MILEAGEVHDQAAVCGEVLLMVGPSAEDQGGAGLCHSCLSSHEATALTDEGLPYGLI